MPGHRRDFRRVHKPKDAKKTIRRLLKYLGGHEIKIITALICVIAGSVSSMLATYMLRPIINGIALEGRGTDFLIVSVLKMTAAYVVSVLCQYAQMRLMLGVAQEAVLKMRNDLFVKLQTLPVRYYDTNNNGDIMSRFTNDIDAVGEVLNATFVQIIAGIITVVGIFSLMVYTSPILTVVTMVVTPVMVTLVTKVTKRGREYFGSQQTALGELNGNIEEIIGGQKVVKVFGHEQKAIEDFAGYSERLRDCQIRAQFSAGIMGPIMVNLSQTNYAITAMVGGLLCVLGGFDIGGLTVFINYSRQISRPLNELSMQTSIIFSALAGAERVFSVLDEEPEVPDREGALSIEISDGCHRWIVPEDNREACGAGDSPGVHKKYPDRHTGDVLVPRITIEDVTFGYESDKEVLKHISLYAKPGQKIAFVGSTGAGKTTITNLINRFYDIDSGCIRIDGVDVRDIEMASLRRCVAMVLQDTHLFTGTIRENIRFGRLSATDEEVVTAAKLASADSFIRRLEHGYDTVIEGDGANLSQGQRQLVNIARAAISDAPILILDEATSSVDIRTEKHIERGMDRIMKDRTTLVIAHRLSTVRNANAIMVLENGEIIERGDHELLLAQKGRYYELCTGLSELK